MRGRAYEDVSGDDGGEEMKIEDINYTLPTTEIAADNFDKEKWLKEHPIDYFKLIYLLLTTTDNPPMNMPPNITMSVTFDVLYAVIRQYIPNVLYKFCSLTTNDDLNKAKFSTLRNKQIFMSDIKDFNDPFDGKAFFYNPKHLANTGRLTPHNEIITDDFTKHIKGTALTENDMNCMPMWAHYSNNHQGYCIAYDMKEPCNLQLSACTFPVQYTDQRLDITSFMKKYSEKISSVIDSQIAQGKKQIEINDLSFMYIAMYLCNIKQSTWQYEKEFRCTTGATAAGMPYIDATPKAIYIGMNCCEPNKKELISIAHELSIPIYQMKFDEFSEDYALEAELIK